NDWATELNTSTTIHSKLIWPLAYESSAAALLLPPGPSAIHVRTGTTPWASCSDLRSARPGLTLDSSALSAWLEGVPDPLALPSHVCSQFVGKLAMELQEADVQVHVQELQA